MAKDAKSEVAYSMGHIHSHCGPTFHDDNYYCRHFIPGPKTGKCERVEGEIEPVMWCQLYKRKTT